MSNRIIISADFNCDLPRELLQENSISTIPFYIKVNNARFQESTEINSSMIRDYFENGNDKLTSTPASVAEYKEYFTGLINDSDVSVIHISVSSKMSSAYANAHVAAKDMKNVTVFDSGLFSSGIGLLVLQAVELVKNNKDIEYICKELKTIRNKISCSFALKTTQYAAQNNRVGPTVSYLLDLFKIKPIIKIKASELTVDGLGFSNSDACAVKYIQKTMLNRKNISDSILFIVFSGCSEEFKQFIYNEITKYAVWKKIYMQDVSATNFCNVGPESFGIMFYTK